MTDYIPKVFLLIVAAGGSSRFSSDVPKQYCDLVGKSVLRRSLEAFEGIPGLEERLVVIHPDHDSMFEKAVHGVNGVRRCYGGRTRQESVYNGIKDIEADDRDIILVHDAARPLVNQESIIRLIEALTMHDAAALALPCVDTLRYADARDMAGDAVSRDGLWAMQTPQGFAFGVLKTAHDNLKEKSFTDDSAMVTEMGHAVKLVLGHKENFKITRKEDWAMAEALMTSRDVYETRIGSGYDVHAFDNDARDVTSVRLCGLDVPHDRKLKGHSDADVGLHAITDAILGAIGKGDIGQHFPPTNYDFEDMDSAVFLDRAAEMVKEKGGRLINVDVTLICERPKVGAHRNDMRARIAEILGISEERVNVKATTTEKLGFTGRSEGIAAQAVVCVSVPASKD